ncbi:unnamed protein product [Citrullus colocynthis]|uniref:Small auxin up regulated protein n=1 Tax=Citrullus colocynthis TaxID=252529 RepID=A0ABP0Z152_9ROSI
MGIRLPSSLIHHAKQILKMKNQSNVPRGHIAVYVGEIDIQRKRFVVPISFLNHPSFKQLLSHAEEEFGFHHPQGGLTIPCKEDAFRKNHSNSLLFLSLKSNPEMGIRLPSILLNAKQIFRMQSISTRCHSNIPKGHIAVYVGETRRKRFVVPVSYLNHPSFLSLLNRAEEEFGFNHPSGGLTIPCKEDAFIDLTSRLHTS